MGMLFGRLFVAPLWSHHSVDGIIARGKFSNDFVHNIVVGMLLSGMFFDVFSLRLFFNLFVFEYIDPSKSRIKSCRSKYERCRQFARHYRGAGNVFADRQRRRQWRWSGQWRTSATLYQMSQIHATAYISLWSLSGVRRQTRSSQRLVGLLHWPAKSSIIRCWLAIRFYCIDGRNEFVVDNDLSSVFSSQYLWCAHFYARRLRRGFRSIWVSIIIFKIFLIGQQQQFICSLC